jgi:hypothetical protein
MLTLHPLNQFTVVRQIANHLDTDTNYVRAVIRNAYTDEIIDTLNLTDRGSQRFSKNWRIPADPSGQGFYISIVTSVYTDAGYASKNANYGDEENTYLVEDRVFAKGGGSGVDARTVRRIIQEELTSLEKAREEVKKNEASDELDDETSSEKEEIEPMRWDEVLGQLNDLTGAVNELRTKEPAKLDYKPFYEGLKSVIQVVNEKEVTKATDLSPVLDLLSEKDSKDGVTKEELVTQLNILKDFVTMTLPKQIGEMFKSTNFGISLTPTTVQMPEGLKEEKEDEEKDKPIPFDINSLAQ